MAEAAADRYPGETPARDLISDVTKEILGVRAQRGEEIDFRQARRAVEADLRRLREQPGEMIRNYPAGCPVCYTSGTPYNEGDGIAMAMSVGADLWHMNNYAGPSMALKVPDIRTTFSMQALHFSKRIPGGMIVVGPDGKRFTDEKYKTRHGKIAVNGSWLPLSTPCPMFMIFDHALFAAGPLYDKHPSHGWTQIIERYEWSQDNSAELAKGWIKTAESLEALGSLLKLDPATLTDTVGRWNRYCDAKHDPDFGRTLMMEPIADGPFYAVELSSLLLQDGHDAVKRADRPPRRLTDCTAVQRRRAGLDLQLSVPGDRKHRGMPGLWPRLRAQCRRRNILGIEPAQNSPLR